MFDHTSQTPRAKQTRLVVEEMAEGTIVYNSVKSDLHSLNSTASFVWKQCDGKRTVAEIVRNFASEYQMPDSQEAVWIALDQLESNGLLEEALTRPVETHLLSRRGMLKHASQGALIALPLVTTMMAPTPANAQSGPTGPTGSTGPTGPTGATAVSAPGGGAVGNKGANGPKGR